jgi:hypothetical protein
MTVFVGESSSPRSRRNVPVEYFELRYKGSHRRIKAIITAYVMLFGSITIWRQQLR